MIKCALDEDDCISLLAVLRIMNQVSQEHTWAIAYEVAALMQRLWPAGNCATIESLAQIHIHRDGFIHEKSLVTAPAGPAPDARTREPAPACKQISKPTGAPDTEPKRTGAKQRAKPPASRQALPPTPPITPELNETLTRRCALDEAELVSSLGIALFWALDYGIPDDEERKLSIAMEYLIVQSQGNLSLNELSDICIKRLPIATKQHADLHYRGICQSLINDTIELSIFLDKIYTASMVLGDFATNLDDCCFAGQPMGKQKSSDNINNCDILSKHVDDGDLSELGLPLASLRALKINDWARLWMQVIRELRQRGKFKQ